MSGSEALPEGWEMVRLSDVGTFKSGSGFPLNAQGKTTGLYPFFKVSDFSNQGNERTLNRANHYIDESDRQRIGARIFPPGTIAFAKIGAAIFLERKRLIEQESCLDNNMAGYTLQNGRVSRDLILANLQQFSLGSLVASTALPAIGSGELNGITFPMPSSPHEQQAIAAALSDADGVVAGLERVIAKKRLIKQGAMQDLLTARRRLPGFSGEWHSLTLFEMADSNKKNFDDGDWIEAKHIAPSGIRLIQTGNVGIGEFLNSNRKYIFEESFLKLRCKEVHPGDVLICRLAEPPGRACIVPDLGEDKMITSVDVTIFRPNRSTADRKLLTEFMSQSSWFARVDEASGGTTRKRIARSRLGRMTLLMPPTKEQQALSELFADMDAEIHTLESRLAKARAVKEGMMQNLLTGRVRLV